MMTDADKDLIGSQLKTMYTSKERIERALELREQLFHLANSFSGEDLDELTGRETGEVAGFIHGACNQLLKAEQEYDGAYKGASRENMTDFFSRMGHGAVHSEMYADLVSELCLGERDEKDS